VLKGRGDLRPHREGVVQMSDGEMAVPYGMNGRPDRTRVDVLRVLRYSDLVGLGIVNNRVTLRRWINSGDFPPPLKLGANSLAWRVTDVADWLASREV
jgi:predicted DNA-binding transcriptional regulator AlpA